MYSISYYHLGWECNGKLCLHRKYKFFLLYFIPSPPDTFLNKPILEKWHWEMKINISHILSYYVGQIWCHREEGGEHAMHSIENIFDIKCINDEWIELFELISIIKAKNMYIVVSVYSHMYGVFMCLCICLSRFSRNLS